MSETLTTQVQVIEGTTKQQRAGYASAIRTALDDEKRAAIIAGQNGLLAKATFTLDEMDAWKDWATKVFRKSYKTVESYLAVAKAYEASTKAQQSKVSGWTFEALQAYASVPESDRNAVIAAVPDKQNPSPEQVRTARDETKLAKLTPAERKQREADRKQREKDGKAERTEKVLQDCKATFRSLKTEGERKAFATGVVIGKQHDEEILLAALKQYEQQLAASAKVVAKAASNLAASAGESK